MKKKIIIFNSKTHSFVGNLLNENESIFRVQAVKKNLFFLSTLIYNT